MVTTASPINANKRTRILASLVQTTSASGRWMQFDPFSLGFCPSGHSLQMALFLLVLIIPVGHFKHSQQQGVVRDWNVPGWQSSRQNDFGMDFPLVFVFQSMSVSLNSSFGFLPFSHEPITVLNGWLFSADAWKWTMSYEDDTGSPEESKLTLPVNPRKSTLRR